MNIDKLLNEMVGEITKQNTITVKDGNNDKRYFTFDTNKLKALDKELNKAYGDKVVKAIMKEISKAIEGDYLKQFANDRSVDFIIKDGELKSVFKQKSASVETDEESSDAVSENTETRVMRTCSKTGKKKLVKKFDDMKSAKYFMKQHQDKEYFVEGAEYNGNAWSGNFSAALLGKIAAYIHKNYGLETIAQKDNIADVQYDKEKQSYIVTFEPTAKDPRNGKLLGTTSIAQGIIDNFPTSIKTPGVK